MTFYRYIFNFLPCLPHTRATMAIIQVQEEHLKCENQIEEEDLLNLCQEMATNPGIFETDQDGTLRKIGGCCDPE